MLPASSYWKKPISHVSALKRGEERSILRESNIDKNKQARDYGMGNARFRNSEGQILDFLSISQNEFISLIKTVRPPPPIASFRASSAAINFRSDGHGYFLQIQIVDGGVALMRQLHHPFDLLIS
ncbi:hypothetical protein F2Q68_00014291 [Brassica cretica]|uniref:Uncharacterized protein n=1 Tax=Brassica cretica TaxID=69181 RepID=A0A8S9HJP1_BRACR|nr:hypothetical protein F2Q68_00014291 [Brassica cretica]